MADEARALPPIEEILEEPTAQSDRTDTRHQTRLIEKTLAEFGVPAKVDNVYVVQESPGLPSARPMGIYSRTTRRSSPVASFLPRQQQ